MVEWFSVQETFFGLIIYFRRIDARRAVGIKTDVVFQKLLDARAHPIGVAAIRVDGKFHLQILVHRFAGKNLGAGRELQRSGRKCDERHGERESRYVLGNHRRLLM